MRGLGKHGLWVFAFAGWVALWSVRPALAQDKGQDVAWGRRKMPPPVCPTPEMEKPPVPPAPGKEPRPPEPMPPEPELAHERAVALGADETVALAAPTLIANL